MTATERPMASSGPSVAEDPPGAGPLRCNAPQRTPRYLDTTWGKPRARLGWSLRQLAEATDINAGELSRIERGRSCPTPDQARRLLAAFETVR